MVRLPSFIIEWDAREYEHKERSADWFWAVWIVVFAIVTVSVIFGNVIFAILILIATFTLSLFINREPDNIHVIVDEKGITKGRLHYPYQSLHSFWIDNEHPHKKILLRSRKSFLPLIIVPLGEEIDTERLARKLTHYLDEGYQSLPFLERVLEYLGF